MLASLSTVVLIFVAVVLSPTKAAADDRPVMVAGRVVPEIQGSWRSRGYGYAVSISREGPKLYHVAGDFCYADPRRQRDPDGMFVLYRPLADGAVAFSRRTSDSLYVFDRVAALPGACADRTPWTPSRIAALVAAIFTDIYPSFREFGIDWPARLAALESQRARITNDASLFEAVRVLLDGIEDAHVELKATVGGKRRDLVPGDGMTLKRVQAASPNTNVRLAERQWRQAYRRGVVDTILQGKGHEAANERVIWGRPGDIGYINLLTLYGYAKDGQGLVQGQGLAAADAVFDQAFEAFNGVRAVILDVSSNTGGSDFFALYVASRFADRRRLAFTKVAVGAQGVEPQPLYVEPSARSRYLGPVYVVMSDVTVSAGEILALAMRELPNVVLVGGETRGAFSDAIDKPLPNGWQLNLSAEIYKDAEGRYYETKGLPPQLRREVFPANDLTGGHPRFVQSLMEEIRRR